MNKENWISMLGVAISTMGLMWKLLSAYSARVDRAVETVSKGVAELQKTVSEEIRGLDARIRVVEMDKVDKRDWIREQVSVRSKVDAIGRDVAALNAKFDASLGIGAQIKGATDAMREVAAKVGTYLESDDGQ